MLISIRRFLFWFEGKFSIETFGDFLPTVKIKPGHTWADVSISPHFFFSKKLKGSKDIFLVESYFFRHWFIFRALWPRFSGSYHFIFRPMQPIHDEPIGRNRSDGGAVPV